MRKPAQNNFMIVMVLILSLAAIFGITGCGGDTSIATSVSSASPRTTILPSPSPTVVLAAPRVSAATTTGWAIYQDPRFAFQVPLPPGWRAVTFTSSTPSGPGYYTVQFFPPQSQGKPGEAAASMEPALIEVTVVSSPPYVTVAKDPSWIAEASPVAIGNTSSTLYDRYASGQEVDRIAELMSGALQFTFTLRVATASASADLNPAEVSRDTSLYLGMMQGFRLTTNY